MKTKLSFVTLIICVIFCCSGCGDGSSSSSRSHYCQQCENLKSQISSLTEENKKIVQNLNNVTAERDAAIVAQKEAEKKARNRYIVLSVIAYTALGVGLLLIGGFIFLARKSNKNMTKGTVDNLHCPRCGWEHAPGETICKNCKTHF